MLADLTSLDDSIEIAGDTKGLTVSWDATATSLGASGDSNAILKGLPDAKFESVPFSACRFARRRSRVRGWRRRDTRHSSLRRA